jgi:uncharacterized protein YidB (DUF937 family)
MAGNVTDNIEQALNKVLGKTGDEQIDLPDWVGPTATTMLGVFAGKAVGGGLGGVLGGLFGGAAGSGALGGMLDKFKGAGAEQQAASWVSTGENQPIDAATVERALGTETIDQIAGETGKSREEVEDGLAKVIPGMVDALTPNGELPDDDTLREVDERIEGGAPPAGGGTTAG